MPAPARRATQATASPWLSASRHSLVQLTASASGAPSAASAPRPRGGRGTAARRRQISSHSTAVPTRAHPGAALVLGDLEGQPTLLGHGRPGGGVVSGRGVGDGGAVAVAVGTGSGQRADDRTGADAGPQRRGRPSGPAVSRPRRAEPAGRSRGRSPRRRGLRSTPPREVTRRTPVPCCDAWICAPRPNKSPCGSRSGNGWSSTCPGPTESGYRRASTTWPKRWRSDAAGRPR